MRSSDQPSYVSGLRLRKPWGTEVLVAAIPGFELWELRMDPGSATSLHLHRRKQTGFVHLSGRGGIPSYQQLDSNDDYHHYVAQYDGEIRYLDRHLGRLFDALRELGMYHDALIVFTSDHGEGMGDNDYYFAHGENLHNSLLRVPMIVRHGD